MDVFSAFLSLLRSIFVQEEITMGDNGVLYISQEEKFSQIEEFSPIEAPSSAEEVLELFGKDRG